MAERVVLHVGVMKSGTTHIQHRLGASKAALAEVGFQFPGRVWNDQILAVCDILDIRRRATGNYDGAWQRLVDQVNAHTGTSIISMEFLGPAKVEQIRKIAGSFDGARVEAVVTVRDLNRSIVAMWQEAVKNDGQLTFREYVDAVRNEGSGAKASKLFWRQQAVGGIVKRWADALGTDAVTVVTVPPPGADPELLWKRFAEAVGLDPEVSPPVPARNESLGVASTEVLRKLNERLEPMELTWAQYSQSVKMVVGKRILAERKGLEGKIGLDVSRWVKARSARIRTTIADSGVRVIGDLADLEPVPVKGSDANKVSTQDQLDAALHALAGLVQQNVKLRAQLNAATEASPGETRV